MFGRVYKFDDHTVTFIINVCCRALLHTVRNDIFKNLEVDDMVYYETEHRELMYLEKTVFDNCYDCWQIQPMSDAQQICYCILSRNIINIIATVLDFKKGEKEIEIVFSNDSSHYTTKGCSNEPFYDLAMNLNINDKIKIKAEIEQDKVTVFYMDKFKDLE